MEPRTATAAQRLKVVKQLADSGVPVGVMCAPIVPGLTHYELPALVKEAADAGACGVGYQVVRLNGPNGLLFTEWIQRSFPDAAEKVLNAIRETHGGKLGDSRFGIRMRGQGPTADAIRQLFRLAKSRYFSGRFVPPYNLSAFRSRPQQGELF
jgi:DNA repair photolyase